MFCSRSCDEPRTPLLASLCCIASSAAPCAPVSCADVGTRALLLRDRAVDASAMSACRADEDETSRGNAVWVARSSPSFVTRATPARHRMRNIGERVPNTCAVGSSRHFGSIYMISLRLTSFA